MKTASMAGAALLMLAVLFFVYRFTRLTSMIDDDQSAIGKARAAVEKECPLQDASNPEKLIGSTSRSCSEAASNLRTAKSVLEDHSSYRLPVLGLGLGGLALGGLLLALALRRKPGAPAALRPA